MKNYSSVLTNNCTPSYVITYTNWQQAFTDEKVLLLPSVTRLPLELLDYH